MNEPTSAVVNLAMVTPVTSWATTRNARTWKTITRTPVRTSEICAVSTSTSERTTALNTAIRTTARRAVAKRFTFKPGSSQAVTRNATAAMRLVRTNRQSSADGPPFHCHMTLS